MCRNLINGLSCSIFAITRGGIHKKEVEGDAVLMLINGIGRVQWVVSKMDFDAGKMGMLSDFIIPDRPVAIGRTGLEPDIRNLKNYS